MVTITGAGLRSAAVQPLSAGTHRLTVALTKRGQAERKRHQEIKLSVRLNARRQEGVSLSGDQALALRGPKRARERVPR